MSWDRLVKRDGWRMPENELVPRLRTWRDCKEARLTGIGPSRRLLLRSSAVSEERRESWAGMGPQRELVLRLRERRWVQWERWRGMGWLKRLLARLRWER